MKRNPQKTARNTWAALASLDPRPESHQVHHLAGARNPNAKLAEVDVCRLRALYAMARELGCTHTSASRGLGVTFGVHPRTVGKIVWGERRAVRKK